MCSNCRENSATLLNTPWINIFPECTMQPTNLHFTMQFYTSLSCFFVFFFTDITFYFALCSRMSGFVVKFTRKHGIQYVYNVRLLHNETYMAFCCEVTSSNRFLSFAYLCTNQIEKKKFKIHTQVIPNWLHVQWLEDGILKFGGTFLNI